MPHPLDRPVWNALVSDWAPLAIGDGRAWRIDPAYGPFGASADERAVSLAALAALVPQDGELWLAERDAIAPPPGVTVTRTAILAQMVASSVTAETRPGPSYAVLTEADAAEMRMLALLTRPGPFHSLTHRLGRFIGIRQNGQLVAMAGERMRMDGFAEVSGVCTHPDHRGRGYAGSLMRTVARAMLDRGDIPFLHAYASNLGAIALYETLGFQVRTDMHMMVLTR